MATEFLMPKLGLTMEEGTITEWLVAEGDAVSSGSAVLRIETDKTETDVEASGSGRLHFVGAIGDTYACGELIGWFLEEGEEIPAAAVPAAAADTAAPAPAPAPAPTSPVAIAATAQNGRIFASPNARRIAAERGLDLATIRGTGPNGRIVSEDLEGVQPTPPAPVATAPPAALPTSGVGVPATAAARQLADLLGIDLAAVAPDPVDRRVTRDAVALHVRGLLAARTETRTPAAAPAMQTPTEVIRFSGMRGTIAKRMHESLQQMAQLTLFMDADFTAVAADRAARKEAGAAPGFTDYVIAASARALREHPRVNSQVTDDGIAILPDVHVGMAVALDEGLIVPVVHDTLAMDLTTLGAETSRLAQAARAGSLTLPELEGGTFSVTTLGMFGVDGFTPVINPPNTAILGVGRIRDDGRSTLSLTWDHRVFDGAPAAAFARTVCELLQTPDRLDEVAT